MRLLLDVTFVCHPVCLRICGKCREMRRSEAEGRFGEAEPEGCACKHPREFRTVCSAVQYCGLYRPNRTPNTESAVGSHVRPARQSGDCLRGRPFRAPSLSVMVRSALGSVQPTVARAFPAFGSRAAPTFGCMFALRCIIRPPIRAVRLRMEYHPSPSITVSTAPYASRRPCALRSPVALRLSPSRY